LADAISQGDIWWVDFGEPVGSEPGFRRPALVIQTDALNRSRLATVIVCPLSTNLRLARAPGNVLIPAGRAGLGRDSVVVVSGITARDRSRLEELIGKADPGLLRAVVRGLQLLTSPDVP
jgi:mRNA interferase MazF